MTGTWPLLRAYLRRDRWMILAWTVGITVLYYSQAVSVDRLYRTQAEFDTAAATMERNTAFIAMAGPARALNTIGGQVIWQSAAFGAICIGLMSMFIVARHTRAGEENGRDELVRAGPVGRRATTAAAAVTAMLACAVVGAAVAVSLLSWPLPAADSLATGVGLALTGWVFTAAALVAAQLSSTTRAVYGITGMAFGAAYLIRAIGDVGASGVSWLSPIGMYQGMHAFSGVRWWPAALLVGAAMVAFGVAAALFDHRDYGSGLIAARPGPARASAALARPGSALGFAWRLHRGTIIGWVIGLALTGAAYGSMGSDIDSLLGEQKTRDAFTAGLADPVAGFYAFALVLLAVLTCGLAISAALRPRAEEAARFENLSATALRRSRWLIEHTAMTVLGTTLGLVAGAAAMGASLSLTGVDTAGWWRYPVAALAYVPAVLVLSGVVRLLYGINARLAIAGWLGLVIAAVVAVFAELVRLPTWVRGLSPFHYVRLVPAESLRWPSEIGLIAVAVVLSAAGTVAFTRRDVGGA